LIHDFWKSHSLSSEHSIISHETLGSPLAFDGQRQVAVCPTALQIAFFPQIAGASHGFLHFEFSQTAASGQSLSVKHSPGFLHPPTTGSPTKPSRHEQMKFPGVFLQIAVS
jgi:hypothetical protein